MGFCLENYCLVSHSRFRRSRQAKYQTFQDDSRHRICYLSRLQSHFETHRWPNCGWVWQCTPIRLPSRLVVSIRLEVPKEPLKFPSRANFWRIHPAAHGPQLGCILLVADWGPATFSGTIYNWYRSLSNHAKWAKVRIHSLFLITLKFIFSSLILLLTQSWIMCVTYNFPHFFL